MPMTNEELIQRVEALRNTMISVATGGPRINDVNRSYQRDYTQVDKEQRWLGLFGQVEAVYK